MGVRRHLGPQLSALVVNDDQGRAQAAIEYCCQRWGGACDALLPMDPNAASIPEPWSLTIDGAVPVSIYTGQANQEMRKIGEIDVLPGDPWTVEPLLSILAGRSAGKENRPKVSVALPPSDHPWFLGYLAALGSWPLTPDPGLLERGGLRADIGFDALVEISRETVANPSGSDLLDRLRAFTSSPPTRAATWLLAPRPSPSRTSLELDLPDVAASFDKAVARNIVVVYTPGSILDLCLLWDLRAAHGLPDGLPLGVPASTDVVSTVSQWQSSFAYAPIGFGDTGFCLVSASVSPEELASIAAGLMGNWRVARPVDVIQPLRPPARPSTDTAVFDGGVAHVAAASPADRDLVSGRPSRYGVLELNSQFELLNQALPPIRSLLRDSLSSGFSGGGYEAKPRRLDDIVEIQWPSGWLVLESAIRDRGLVARPSKPGRTAAALLRALGSLDELEWLIDRPLLDRLYVLGERRGISWFRRRAADLARTAAAAGDDERLAAIERQLLALTARPFENEQHDVTFGTLKSDLRSRQAAREWLRWAEGKGLLVRGGQFVCQNCGLVSWQAIGELGPALSCRGCGQALVDPFGEENLTFRYRASELLLGAIETDSLPHAYALRWFAGAFDRSFGMASRLYGGYPGVEILDPEGTVVAEVDVLLLGADGSLVPGEVKRHGSGLTQGDLDKLDDVAARLGSPWSFVATTDWFASCPPIWQEASRRAEAPRVVLTGEFLLEPYPIVLLGPDRFGIQTTDDQAVADHHKAFCDRIEHRHKWQRAIRVPGRLDLDDGD